MFVGTYTRRRSKGIYAWRCDSKGKLFPLALAGESRNPSFLAVGPHDCLYAVNENDTGTVSAFSFDRSSGALKLLNTVQSRGASPCHVSLDRSGKWLFAANYDSGSVAMFPVRPSGALGEASAFAQHSGSSVDPERQLGPHAHMVLPSPDNRFLLAPDLGLDQVRVYRFDSAKGSLTPNDPAGGRPRPGLARVTLCSALEPASCMCWVRWPPRYASFDTTPEAAALKESRRSQCCLMTTPA